MVIPKIVIIYLVRWVDSGKEKRKSFETEDAATSFENIIISMTNNKNILYENILIRKPYKQERFLVSWMKKGKMEKKNKKRFRKYKKSFYNEKDAFIFYNIFSSNADIYMVNTIYKFITIQRPRVIPRGDEVDHVT